MAARTPKKPEVTEETLSEPTLVRLSPTEKAALSALAKADSRTLSAWCRLALLEKARAQGAKV